MDEWPKIRVDNGNVPISSVDCIHRSDGCVIYEISVGEKNPHLSMEYVFEDRMCHTMMYFFRDGGPVSRVIFSFPESEEWEDISESCCRYSMRVAFYLRNTSEENQA